MQKENLLKSYCKKMLSSPNTHHSSSRSVSMRDIVAGVPNASLYPGFARAASTGMTSEASVGFTLIELLVVVLIIGILAAVALPKYQVAVTKARVARLLPLLKNLRDAQDAYYLSNGKYAFKFEELSIDIPTPKSITAATNTYGEIAVYDDYEIRICSSSQIAYVGTSDILLGWYLTESPDTDCDTKKLAIVKKSNKVANDVIRTMGGQEYRNGRDIYYCLP